MLSLPHLIVLFLIALVVFGPEKLPELARMLGKVTSEMRKMTSDFRYALEDEIRDLDRQARVREEETSMRNMPNAIGTIHSDTAPPASAPTSAPASTPRVTPFPTGEEYQLELHEQAPAHSEPRAAVETPTAVPTTVPITVNEPVVAKHPDEKAPDDPSGV